MKVVMSAYACDPEQSSERGIGWWWACAAAERHEVWVITRERSRPAIERALRESPCPNLHPVYVDLPKWARWWKRGALALYPYYFLWQGAAFRCIRQLHRRERFDVAHHVTFATDWMPAAAIYVPGLPSVWGPVGPGITSFPVTLVRELGTRWALSETVRSLGTSIASRVVGDPTARRASVILAQNREVARRYGWHPRIEIEQNSVVDIPVAARTISPGGDNHLRRALFVGRLSPGKVCALPSKLWPGQKARTGILTSSVMGPTVRPSPPWRRGWGVEDRVCFRGSVGRSEVFKAVCEAEVLLFPSTRDSAPGVVAEAISSGCPVLCFTAVALERW